MITRTNPTKKRRLIARRLPSNHTKLGSQDDFSSSKHKTNGDIEGEATTYKNTKYVDAED